MKFSWKEWNHEIYRYGCASWYLQRPPTLEVTPLPCQMAPFPSRRCRWSCASRVGWSVISHPFQHPVIPPKVNGVFTAYVAILQITSLQKVLLMDEILHQLIGRISHSLQDLHGFQVVIPQKITSTNGGWHLMSENPSLCKDSWNRLSHPIQTTNNTKSMQDQIYLPTKRTPKKCPQEND